MEQGKLKIPKGEIRGSIEGQDNTMDKRKLTILHSKPY
jgi:hypothetical protein